MRSKIKYVCLALLLTLIFYQFYIHVSNDANVSLRVDSHEVHKKGLALIYINGTLKDTVNFDRVNPYVGSHKLSIGENKIFIQSIDDQSTYETTISYFGLYTWVLIQYKSKHVEMKRFYMQPRYR